MCSILPVEARIGAPRALQPRRRATWRWGGTIAVLLIVQSLILAGLFWLLATGSHRRAAERGFAQDCRALADLAAPSRRAEVRAMLTRDIHRDRFVALFAGDGRRIEGNVARLPASPARAASFVATVRPTELPGKASDVARLAVCAMPDGTTLVTGLDLDNADEALRVIGRSLLFGLVPGLLLAIGFGLVAGRRAARQVDAVRSLTARIIAGEFAQRLPVGARPDSFGMLCAHINAMLDRLESLMADVRGVGDDIAHQLRTPLTRLRARLERGLCADRDAAAFAATGQAALAEIDQLLGIVAALLRVRELEDHARRSRFAIVDLAQLVEDAYELHRPVAEDRGIELVRTIAPVAPVEGDASLLIEAVSNLIDNAMKFGPPGGRVMLSLRPEGEAAMIVVADDGAGVPAAERSLVTQRFYRGRHECEGAGLGLSLVKAIADLHGFTLRFAEQGSAVALIGPAAGPAEDGPAALRRIRAPAPGIRPRRRADPGPTIGSRRRRHRLRLGLVLLPVLAAGCVADRPAAPAPLPPFDPIAFFSGRTEGRGSLNVLIRRAQPVRVVGTGTVGADGAILLEQEVRQGDAAPTRRRWRLERIAADHYAGTLSDARGAVSGDVSGNRLHLRFAMRGGLQVQQWLYLRRGGQIADNRMIVSKFGIVVARLAETITRVSP